MKKKVTMMIKGQLNIDVAFDDELSIIEVLDNLVKNRIAQVNVEQLEELATLLVSGQKIHLNASLRAAKIQDGEFIYMEMKGY
ncbi:MAG: hypothetical protein ACRCUP_00185 [Mycoplasmatales bacterium]